MSLEVLLWAIKTLPQVEELHRTEVKGRNQEWRGNPVRKIEVSGECLLGDLDYLLIFPPFLLLDIHLQGHTPEAGWWHLGAKAWAKDAEGAPHVSSHLSNTWHVPRSVLSMLFIFSRPYERTIVIILSILWMGHRGTAKFKSLLKSTQMKEK